MRKYYLPLMIISALNCNAGTPSLSPPSTPSLISSPDSSSCQSNVDNFDYELSQSFGMRPYSLQSWGPARNHLLLSPTNPNLTLCLTTDESNTKAISWMQNRLLAAYDFWVKQKLNYCHHHVPDFATPLISKGTPRSFIAKHKGGYCNAAVDLLPGSVYYGQAVRWNYTGKGLETAESWHDKQKWYGLDCSNFTSFMYNFAFGIQFSSATDRQAGDDSQNLLTPNGQTASNRLKPFDNTNPHSAAGVLVCKNGQTEQELPECGGLGTNGYFSVFLGTDIRPTPTNITAKMLTLLQPGDLLFLGFARKNGKNSASMVTHVITWTGKKVGYGAHDIKPAQIAPNKTCPTSWQPQIGDWVIVDSHYQGPDYRVFTPCFYRNNIWGVRRVIGYMQ